MTPIIIPPIYEGGQAVLLARFMDDDGTALLQADCSEITFKSYKKGDSNVVVEGTLNISAVISDTLLTTRGWAVDTTGYNFFYKTPITAAPQVGDYVFEIKITEAGGDVCYQTWEVTTLNLNQR